MSDNLDDLRREVRINTTALVTVSFKSQDGDDKDQCHICAAEDISAGGIKLITRRVLPVGTELPLQITVFEQSLDVTGEVKWCLEIDQAPTFYAGIKVLRINSAGADDWRQFVAGIASHQSAANE